MTPEQKKQVIDACVKFVISATDGSSCISQAEASALPSVLEFLLESEPPERLYRTKEKLKSF